MNYIEEENYDFISKAHNEATEWARALLQRDPATWVILDTETTGLGNYDEVIQIGAIDGEGKVLIDNTLVKPTVPITEGARQVHGITHQMLEDAPRITAVWNLVYQFTEGKLLVIYNADYDTRMFQQSARNLDFKIGWGFEALNCAMQRYAEWVGEWNDYHGSFRWQRLAGGDHSALGDCRATLALIRRMAEG